SILRSVLLQIFHNQLYQAQVLHKLILFCLNGVLTNDYNFDKTPVESCYKVPKKERRNVDILSQDESYEYSRLGRFDESMIIVRRSFPPLNAYLQGRMDTKPARDGT